MSEITNRQLNITAAGQIALNLDKLDEKGSDGIITKNIWEDFWAKNDAEGKYKGRNEAAVGEDGISVRDAMKFIMTRIFNAAKALKGDVNKIGADWLKGMENVEKLDANDIDELKDENKTEETQETETIQATETTEAKKSSPSQGITKGQCEQVKDNNGEFCKGIYYHKDTNTYYKEVKGKLVQIKSRTGFSIDSFMADGSHWESGKAKNGRTTNIRVSADNKKLYAYEDWDNGNTAIHTTYDKNEKQSYTNKYNKDGILVEQRNHEKGITIKYAVHKNLGNGKYILKFDNGRYIIYIKGKLDFEYECDENGNPLQ